MSGDTMRQFGDQQAQKFIELYQSGMPAKHICTEMGWQSIRPPQRVHRQLKRLRDRGYVIPTRMPNQNRGAQKS